MDSEGEGEGGIIWENSIETCMLSCKKRITSLCLMQETRGWCTEMIWRDDVGWEVGGEFMFGSSCTPMVDSCQCMPKPIQYCKVTIKFFLKIISVSSQRSQLSFSPLLLEAVLNKVHLADTGYTDCLSVPLHPVPLGCLSVEIPTAWIWLIASPPVSINLFFWHLRLVFRSRSWM